MASDRNDDKKGDDFDLGGLGGLGPPAPLRPTISGASSDFDFQHLFENSMLNYINKYQVFPEELGLTQLFGEGNIHPDNPKVPFDRLFDAHFVSPSRSVVALGRGDPIERTLSRFLNGLADLYGVQSVQLASQMLRFLSRTTAGEIHPANILIPGVFVATFNHWTQERKWSNEDRLRFSLGVVNAVAEVNREFQHTLVYTPNSDPQQLAWALNALQNRIREMALNQGWTQATADEYMQYYQEQLMEPMVRFQLAMVARCDERAWDPSDSVPFIRALCNLAVEQRILGAKTPDFKKLEAAIQSIAINNLSWLADAKTSAEPDSRASGIAADFTAHIQEFINPAQREYKAAKDRKG